MCVDDFKICNKPACYFHFLPLEITATKQCQKITTAQGMIVLVARIKSHKFECLDFLDEMHAHLNLYNTYEYTNYL